MLSFWLSCHFKSALLNSKWIKIIVNIVSLGLAYIFSQQVIFWMKFFDALKKVSLIIILTFHTPWLILSSWHFPLLFFFMQQNYTHAKNISFYRKTFTKSYPQRIYLFIEKLLHLFANFPNHSCPIVVSCDQWQLFQCLRKQKHTRWNIDGGKDLFMLTCLQYEMCQKEWLAAVCGTVWIVCWIYIPQQHV